MSLVTEHQKCTQRNAYMCKSTHTHTCISECNPPGKAAHLKNLIDQFFYMCVTCMASEVLTP
jgi:hypothetical protein